MTTVVPLGADGSVEVLAQPRRDDTTGSTTHGAPTSSTADPESSRRVTVDVLGVFVAAPTGPVASGRFVPDAIPTAVADTRRSRDPVTAGRQRVIDLAGIAPPDALAAAVRITALPRDRQDGTLTAHAPDQSPTDAVHLGVGATDRVRSVTTFVGLHDGRFAITSSFSTEMVVEVLGHVTGTSGTPSLDGRYVALDTPTRALDTFHSAEPHSGGSLSLARVDLPDGVAASALLGTATSFLSVSAPGNHDDPDVVTSSGLVLVPVADHGAASVIDPGGAVVVDVVGAFTGIGSADAWPAHPSEVRTPMHPTGYCDTITAGTNGLNVAGNAPVEVRRIGTSVQGRPIWAELHGTRGAPRRAIVVNQVHGDECSLNRLLLALRTTDIAEVELWVIPTLTPDGYANGKRRNARDRDLNGDGHTRSEPETWALMSFTEQLRPDLTVHVHSPNGFVGWFGGPDSEQLARRIGAGTGLRVSESGARPDRGRWFLWQGQQQFWQHDTLLVEFIAIANQEVPMARPRPPTRSIAVADEHARIVVHELLAHLSS